METHILAATLSAATTPRKVMQPVSREERDGRIKGRAISAGLVMAVMTAGVALLGGNAHAAVPPSTQVTFSPSTITAGSRPDLTFTSQDAPPGALFILQESADGGVHWKSVERTNNAAGSSYLAAASAGVFEYRVLMTRGSTVLATSAPATLTVTDPGSAAPSPAPTAAVTAAAPPASAPSSAGLPWMEFIVKPVWDAIVGAIIGWVLSLL